MLRYLNAACLDLTGVALEEALGGPAAETLAGSGIDAALLDQVYRTGQPERRQIRRPGENRTVAVWPWGEPDGPGLLVLEIVSNATSAQPAEGTTDTTELRDVNEQLIMSGMREREVSARTAERLVGAEAASEAKSIFISNISHELRTPLNGVIGFVELLSEGLAGPLTAEQKQMLDRVKAAALHLLELIEQILTFSRTEAGKTIVQPEPADITIVARDAASLIEPLLDKKHLAFRTRGLDTPIQAITDPRLIYQILLNLLSNAVKFTDVGEVCLDVHAEEDDLVAVISDTGIGIEPGDIGRIFEPFERIESKLAEPSEGTGLGLTVSKRLASLLGGDLTVQSTLGVGSAFTLRIPLRFPEAETAEHAPA